MDLIEAAIKSRRLPLQPFGKPLRRHRLGLHGFHSELFHAVIRHHEKPGTAAVRAHAPFDHGVRGLAGLGIRDIERSGRWFPGRGFEAFPAIENHRDGQMNGILKPREMGHQLFACKLGRTTMEFHQLRPGKDEAVTVHIYPLVIHDRSL